MTKIREMFENCRETDSKTNDVISKFPTCTFVVKGRTTAYLYITKKNVIANVTNVGQLRSHLACLMHIL